MDDKLIIGMIKKGSFDSAGHLENYLFTIGSPKTYGQCVELFKQAEVGFIHRQVDFPGGRLPEITGEY